jgi:hypothetical protein
MGLHEPCFRAFPLEAVSPRGWLARQLRIQADGLSGHLDGFWPDVKESAWIGGKAEGWERMPYWLDGVIPLAWLTGDIPLQRRISGYLDYILDHQHSDGWLGPRMEENKEAADLWSQALALKMLLGYHDATRNPRVPVAVEKALCMLDRLIDFHPLSNWGQFRWFEFLLPIWWLYERTGEPRLLDLAVKLHAQGFHWQAFFRRWPLKEPTAKGRWSFAGHVVNNAMALKEGALWWRLTGEDADRGSVYERIRALDRHHGIPTGVFTGDECLAGTDARQGTELCAVAEYMFSLECLLGLLGDPAFADRLETIAFNALPATFSPDMWVHQYVQQLNQIECSVRQDHPWNSSGADANIFGLEPNYGCCTANLSQAWPKFTAHLWMRAPAGGIAAVAYAPSKLETDIDGIPVTIELRTDYPFRQEIDFTVRVGRSARFPFLVRVPAWAEGATVAVQGEGAPREAPFGFHVLERSWQGTTTVRLTLPMVPRIIPRPNRAVSICRGPLLYALRIGEDWRRINRERPLREPPHADWEVHSTTPWNYALELGEGREAEAIVFREHPIRAVVFSPETPPVTAEVAGRRVPAWTPADGSAGPVPSSPVQTDEKAETLVLVPYGCTNLRIAEFPVAGPG